MRWTNAFIPTLKEDPAEAEAVSHKLMMRAGFIRRLTAGAYTYLPLGWKILKKAEEIIREEINSAGAQELLMPALHPIELWKQTGRYDVMGDVMIKFKDRHGKEIALGPTHEEIVTDLVSKEIRSYKDLPIILYQIQTKFRDELRPRFGVVRSCEFIMKDAYSFDTDSDNMEKSYKAMYDAYCRIFTRCGLPYIAVEADPGLMGGTVSHEFMIPSEIGEDRIVICSSCGYASSTEVAAVARANVNIDTNSSKQPNQVDTPGLTGIEEVSKFLGLASKKLIKTLLYIADGEPLAVLIRGDHEANETKIKNHLNVTSLELASCEQIREITNAPKGFSGPVGLSVKIIADNSVKGLKGAAIGANIKDKHLINVDEGRDFKVDNWLDARIINSSDPCPKCNVNIEIKNAIEIGHTFKLGTKYSSALGTKFLDENGKEQTVVMGCYGIGVNRILASLIEVSHDKNGIIWPVSLCPYKIVVLPVKMQEDQVTEAAERIYAELKEKGIDVILDDRDKSAGIKFKDADLIGFPYQIIVGSKSLKDGSVEVKTRATGEKQLISKDEVVEHVLQIIVGTCPMK